MSKLLLPYKFSGISLNLAKLFLKGRGLTAKHLSYFYLGDGIYSQFSQIYVDVLQAICDNDQEYLKNIMEENLFKQTQLGIQQIIDQNQKLKYIQSQESKIGEEILNEDEEQEGFNLKQDSQEKNSNEDQIIQNNLSKALPYFYNEKDCKIAIESMGVFGVKINRKDNFQHHFNKIDVPQNGRTYYFNFNHLSSLYYDQIIALNVYFQTSRKVYLTNNQDELVEGSDNIKEFVSHKWRFESYIPNLDWVLTDMDDILQGNSYIKQQKKK